MSKALLLDFDGTLADSISSLKRVYAAFLAQFGVAGSESEFNSINGPPLSQIVDFLQRTHGLPGSLQSLEQSYLALIASSRLTTPPAEGADRLLREARQLGWRIALVSSSSHGDVERWLERNLLRADVDLIVGGDQVRCGKPDPEPYALALAQLGCPAGAALAVEDSRMGARSAMAAGVRTFAIAPADDRSDWPGGVRFISGLNDLQGHLAC